MVVLKEVLKMLILKREKNTTAADDNVGKITQHAELNVALDKYMYFL